MEFTTILLEKKSTYYLLTLNRPEKLNALNATVLAELDAALTMVENDSTNCTCLVITGSGPKSFAAGADIAQLHQQNGSTGKSFAEYGQSIFSRIENFPLPVIAAVNGFALGGGCELAMSAHIRYASENAKFSQPEVSLGIIPGYGGTQRLPKLVGYAKAIELTISGNMITATEALSIGLVNAVCPYDELMMKVEAFIDIVSSKGQLAVRASLDAIRAAANPTINGMNREAELFGSLCATEDFKEGTMAFLEKRSPEFTSR
jgi:enoyl-CoA hydratase